MIKEVGPFLSPQVCGAGYAKGGEENSAPPARRGGGDSEALGNRPSESQAGFHGNFAALSEKDPFAHKDDSLPPPTWYLQYLPRSYQG